VKRELYACVAAAGLASAAAGQQQIVPGRVDFTLEYDRVSATGAVLGRGVLQPEEWVWLRLRFNYSPGYGTPVTWPASILAGSSGSGTVLGFWGSNHDIVVSGGGPGVWSQTTAGSLPVRRRCVAPFNAEGAPCAGFPNASGTAVENLQPGQFTGSISTVSSSNNFVVWQAAWRPVTYSEANLSFTVLPGSFGIPTYMVARDSNPAFPLPVPGIVSDTRGGVTVPMIPSPSALGLACATAVWAGRRRCRSHVALNGEHT
jgi:hypothetical protein